jgi:HlyD family secretion protein
MKKALQRVALVLLALGIVVGGYLLYRSATKPAALTYRTVKADRGRIVARVTATGTLSALVTVQVGSQVSGRIQQIFADFNSTVKRGQIIAKLDPQLFEATVARERANLYAAEGNLSQARARAIDADR